MVEIYHIIYKEIRLNTNISNSKEMRDWGVFQKRKEKYDFIFYIELVFLKINYPFTFKLYLTLKKYEGKKKNIKKIIS